MARLKWARVLTLNLDCRENNKEEGVGLGEGEKRALN